MLACSDAPTQPAQQSYTVVPGWPAVAAEAQLGHVSGVTVGPTGDVWLFHRADRTATVFTPGPPITVPVVLRLEARTGIRLQSWGANQFVTPHGLTVDSAGNLWLTDLSLNQVFKYAPDGRVLMTLGLPGFAGEGPGLFSGPSDVAVARDGSFYVSDGYGNSRVVKYDRDGHFLFQWGSFGTEPGKFNLPHSLALDAEELVYVADRGNARVQVFTPQGQFVRELSGPQLGRPWAVAFDRAGQLFVVDGGDPVGESSNRGRVIRADARTGAALETFSSLGTGPGELYWPHDIAIDSDGAVYIGEIITRRAQKFVR